MKYAIYDPDDLSGKLLSVVESNVVPDLPLDESTLWMIAPDNAHPETHYLINGEIVERQDMPVLISPDGLSIAGIPDGASVRLGGDASDNFTMDDSGIVNFTLDPGSYVLFVYLFPYKDLELRWTVPQ